MKYFVIFTVLVAISAFLLNEQIPLVSRFEEHIGPLPPQVKEISNEISNLISEYSRPLLAIVSQFLAPSAVKLHVFTNGADSSNVTHTIALNDTRSFEDIQKEIAALAYPKAEITQVVLYNDLGDIFTSLKQFRNGMEVYVVINGNLFMHSGKYVGYTRIVGGVKMTTLSTSPKVFLVKNFLTVDQADEIVNQVIAQGGGHRSVVYQENGEDVSSTRTSSTAYVHYPSFMLDRALNVTKMPSDPTYLYPDYELQVIYYKPNQYFHPHHDGFFIESVGDEKWFDGGLRNRYLTLFLYLNNVEAGGETAFIQYDEYVKFYQQSDKYDVHTNNPCDKAQVSMTPSKGDGILFYNLTPEGQQTGEIDWSAVHSGCGVKLGEKWACNVWMYNKPIYEPEYMSIMRNVGLVPQEETAPEQRQE